MKNERTLADRINGSWVGQGPFLLSLFCFLAMLLTSVGVGFDLVGIVAIALKGSPEVPSSELLIAMIEVLLLHVCLLWAIYQVWRLRWRGLVGGVIVLIISAILSIGLPARHEIEFKPLILPALLVVIALLYWKRFEAAESRRANPIR